MQPGPKITLFYDNSGYTETTSRSHDRGRSRPMGLMGREVAGKEFLDAYLRYGTWAELVALADDSASLETIRQTCVNHETSKAKKRRLQMILTSDFQKSFCQHPVSNLIHFPCPADAKLTWARRHAGNHAFALCGVTHTLCSLTTVTGLQQLVTAPFESYDRLICTSRAVISMAEAVLDGYSSYLRDRFGGEPRTHVPLELVPLGVNCERFRPPQQTERNEARQRFNVHDDELVVLFVGRFSHHAKANPFPMYRSLEIAAQSTGRKLHLLMSGWSANAQTDEAFQDGAKRFAPHVRCSFVDGTHQDNRFRVWHAADMFMSLSDNVQETFGLVIVEAMAAGLPVIASDWNGYRDLVVPNESGMLAETYIPTASAADLTVQLITGEINYDHYLARTVQHVTVSVESAARCLIALIQNESLRKEMGNQARQRATQLFDWHHVIRKYEQIWQQQLQERTQLARKSQALKGTVPAYPPLSESFAAYPTDWIDDQQSVRSTPTAAQELPTILAHGLTNFEAAIRLADEPTLLRCIERACKPDCIFADLFAIVRDSQRQESDYQQKAISTIAWLLKYDLLRLGEPGKASI